MSAQSSVSTAEVLARRSVAARHPAYLRPAAPRPIARAPSLYGETPFYYFNIQLFTHHHFGRRTAP